jgi:hypothetical protein
MVYDINLSMEHQAFAERGGRLEPERLKFITEHVSGSQGLVLAAMGVWLFLNSEESWPFPWWGNFLIRTVSVLLVVLVYRYLPKYYERRFGRVEAKGMTPLQAMIVGALIITIPIFLIGWQIVALIWGSPLNSLVSQCESWFDRTIPLPANTYLLGIWLLGLFSSFKSLRFDPFRPYFHLLGTIATCVVVFCPYLYTPTKEMVAWKILKAGWPGLSYVAIGLYFHVPQVRFMPKHAGDDDDES